MEATRLRSRAASTEVHPQVERTPSPEESLTGPRRRWALDGALVGALGSCAAVMTASWWRGRGLLQDMEWDEGLIMARYAAVVGLVSWAILPSILERVRGSSLVLVGLGCAAAGALLANVGLAAAAYAHLGDWREVVEIYTREGPRDALTALSLFGAVLMGGSWLPYTVAAATRQPRWPVVLGTALVLGSAFGLLTSWVMF